MLYVLYVHPDYRRRGAGNLFMEWGTRKADELGLNSYIEASEMGKMLYLKHGFEVVSQGKIHGTIDDKDKTE